MAVSTGHLLTIGNQVLTNIKDYTVQYAKLWKDADRNMAGNINANLIGIFTKIKVNFADGLTESEIANLVSIFNQAYFNVTYWDTATQATRTENFYANDFDTTLLIKRKGLYKGFSVNLIATAKRS